MSYSADIKKLPRHYLPKDFVLTDWAGLEPFFKELGEREILGTPDLEQWLKDISELEAAVSEDACWRQIKMTCDTENKTLEEAFNFFVMNIQPHIQPYADGLNRKLTESPFAADLEKSEKGYAVYLRSVRKNIDLFRAENIPLQSELSILQQQYSQITGRMTIAHNGQEFTLQQATKFLQSKDRSEREGVYRKIQDRRLEDRAALDNLYVQLVNLRQQVAGNAGFDNYRDYKFKELGRFDYSKADCYQFHEGVKNYVIPLVEDMYTFKRAALGVETLRPWDLDAEPEGVLPLKPFSTSDDLLQKTINCLEKLNPFLPIALEPCSVWGTLI